MLRLEGNNFSKKFILFIWFLMAFQAGYINVGGFLIFGNFVSHVTGTSSQIGMGLASLNLSHVLTFIIILLAFITGSAFSGHFLARKIEENKEPQYILVTGVKALFFGLVLLLSEVHFLLSDSDVKFLIIFLLSLCCGIQNSTCSIATNGFLKPTHMTGLSTDIGIHLTKVFAWKDNNSKFREELNRNLSRIGILFSFIFGGIIAMLIFSNNGHYGFLFPFLSSLCMLSVSILTEGQKYSNKTPVMKIARSSILCIFLLTVMFGFYQI